MEDQSPPIKNENPQRSPYQHPTLRRNDGLYNASFSGDDSLIGGSRLPMNDENPQLRPYSSSTNIQSNGSIRRALFMTSPSYESSIEVPDYYYPDYIDDDSLIGGSSSSSDTIGPPINHENPQLLPYPSSSTSLHIDEGPCDTSFMTSPSYDSFIEVPNYIAEVCLR